MRKKDKVYAALLDITKNAGNVTRTSCMFNPQQANQIQGPALCVTVLKGHFVLTSESNVNFTNKPDKNYKFLVPKFLRTLFQYEYHTFIYEFRLISSCP